MRNRRSMCLITAFIIFSVIMTACGRKSATPTEVTQQFLEAVKAKDSDTIKNVYAKEEFDLTGDSMIPGDDTDKDSEEGTSEEAAEDSLSKENKQLMEEKLLDFDYVVENEKIEGDKATVDVTITTYKFADAYTGFFTEYMKEAFSMAFSGASEKEIDEKMNAVFKDEIEKLTKKESRKKGTLSLSKKEDQWVIDEIPEDSDFMDAITGGMVSFVKNFNDALKSDD